MVLVIAGASRALPAKRRLTLGGLDTRTRIPAEVPGRSGGALLLRADRLIDAGIDVGSDRALLIAWAAP